MKKLTLNFLFFLASIGIVFIYIHFRLLDTYESFKISKLDGLFTEIVGGLIFLVLLIIVLKPSINICTKFAEIPSMTGSEKHLRFKIVNTSLFKAYDLQVHIFHKKHANLSGADITSKLIASFEGHEVGISYLQSSLNALFEDSRTNAAQFRFFKIDTTDNEIREILNSSDSYLEVHVYLRNGLSGLQGNFIKKFHNSTCIKSGFYKHGFSTDITI
jgi:hypothetical protein